MHCKNKISFCECEILFLTILYAVSILPYHIDKGVATAFGLAWHYSGSVHQGEVSQSWIVCHGHLVKNIISGSKSKCGVVNKETGGSGRGIKYNEKTNALLHHAEMHS
jgi:hypothetical protein